MAKDLMIRSSSAEFLIFERQTHDKGIQVRFEDGDLWLTQKAIGELFNTTRNNITMHINDIYDSYELEQNSTSNYPSCNMRQTKNEKSFISVLVN